MTVDQITLDFFRSYVHEEANFDPGINVIVGENAQGKTNLLESIYLLACGKSFRVPRSQEMIRHGKDFAEIRAVISGDSLPFSLSFRLHRKKLCF